MKRYQVIYREKGNVKAEEKAAYVQDVNARGARNHFNRVYNREKKYTICYIYMIDVCC